MSIDRSIVTEKDIYEKAKQDWLEYKTYRSWKTLLDAQSNYEKASAEDRSKEENGGDKKE